ncbi:phage late control D family protein [Marinobacterium rhizophilum]|uniref:phage late control D family protein n=1 Tax=Marinobacterium rhizophilum TaxID=420402 RepID=UPI00035ECCE9|nr:contractile injection system protein, VgrG/Pvc8 family [Marinobacterium rhizophilum]
MLPDWLNLPIRDPAACIVRINGEEIDDLYPLLVELSAVLDRRESAEATLLLETRRLEDGRWNVHDDDRIRPWAEIAIAASFGDQEAPVFDGYIRQVKVDLPEDQGGATVTLICQDTSLLLDRTQRNFRWGDRVPVSDGEIVRRIAGEAGIGLIEPVGEGFSDLVVNQNETDIRFLKKRAEENGYDFFFREGELYFGPARLDLAAQPTILVYAGPASHAIRFELDDDGHHPTQVIYEIAGESDDQTREQAVSSDLDTLGSRPADEVTGGHGDFAWRLSREGLGSDSQARQRAQALVNEEALRIKAGGELDGTLYGHVLLPGDPVSLDGIGEQYGGRWFVSHVEHRFDAGGYRQSFELLRNGYGDDLDSSASPLAAVI